MLLGEMSDIEKSQFLTQQRQFQKLTADIDEMEKEIESTRIQSHQERFQPRRQTSILYMPLSTLSYSMLGEIQWMGLQQPAGRDYVQSKEYRLYCIVQSYEFKCQKLGKSPYRETRPVSKSKIFGRISPCVDFPNIWHLI